MKRTLLAIALATACLSAPAATFNYHGNLQDGGLVKAGDGAYYHVAMMNQRAIRTVRGCSLSSIGFPDSLASVAIFMIMHFLQRPAAPGPASDLSQASQRGPGVEIHHRGLQPGVALRAAQVSL